MRRITKKAKDIVPGDVVFHQDYPATVLRVSCGFWKNSRIIEWGYEENDWCCVNASADVAVTVS